MSEIDVRDLQCENCRKFSHCNNNDLVCIRKFRQLKAENEELKEIRENLHKCNRKIMDEKHNISIKNIKYKHCLDEIEEIVTKYRVADSNLFMSMDIPNVRKIFEIIKRVKEGEE